MHDRARCLLLLAVVLVAVAPGARADSASSEVAVTLSATADELDLRFADGEQGASAGGLVVRVTLENQTASELRGIAIRLPIPAQTRAESGWREDPRAPRVDLRIGREAVTWSGLALAPYGRLGPLAQRLVPDREAEGARIFREAAIQPEVTWTTPQSGRAAAPLLRLNGLWGEQGLRRTSLPSGLTVFTRERLDTPTVAISLAVRAGSRDEDDTTSGGSHWLEHAYFLGTERRPTQRDLSDAIEAVGGDSNASTGWESTQFWYLVPAEHFALALEVLGDQMLNSTFSAEAFDRERQVVAEELKRRHDAPGTRAFDELVGLIFAEGPLRRHPGGTIESVESIPIETILAYRDQRYVSGNIAVAVAGDIRHDDAVEQVRRTLADLPTGPSSERPRAPEPFQEEPKILQIGEGTRLAEIRLGWPVPGDDNEDSAALVLITDILGGTGRRLAEEIRDRRGLATSVGPGYLLFSDGGAFLIAASTSPENAEAVIELILAELQRIQEGDLTDEDIRRSLRASAGRRAVGDEPNQAQTGRAEIEVAGVLDSFEEYLARLRDLQVADVQRVARAYLHVDNFSLVIVRA